MLFASDTSDWLVKRTHYVYWLYWLCGLALTEVTAYAGSIGAGSGGLMAEVDSQAEVVQKVLTAIADHGAAPASAIAQLLFPHRSPAGCKMLVSRTWQPVLQRRQTCAGQGRPSPMAVASVSELDCVLAATKDAGEYVCHLQGHVVPRPRRNMKGEGFTFVTVCVPTWVGGDGSRSYPLVMDLPPPTPPPSCGP